MWCEAEIKYWTECDKCKKRIEQHNLERIRLWDTCPEPYRVGFHQLDIVDIAGFQLCFSCFDEYAPDQRKIQRRLHKDVYGWDPDEKGGHNV